MPSVNSSSSRIARPELVGIVGRRREQDLPRIARRTDEPRHVAQQPLREVGEAQLLEVLHLAAHDALVHRLVQRNQRRARGTCAAPGRPAASTGGSASRRSRCCAEQLDRGLDLVRQRRRRVDGEAQHRLQRRFGERHDGAGAPAFRQQLLDELEPRDLVGRIDAIAERVAQRRGKAVAALPHVELLAAQAR